jgi:8-oxo-dGTP diphosphatase
MNIAIPEFGSAVSGQEYVLRPGSYGIITDSTGAIAVVLTPLGVFLPGGGKESDESTEATLIREVAEECGLAIEIGRFLGVADELVYSQAEGTFFRKRCSFFTAQVGRGREALGGESDHELKWIAPEQAASQLSYESQRWAVIISRETQPPRS